MSQTNFKAVNATLFICLMSSQIVNAASENKVFNKVCQSCHTGGFKGFMSGAPSIEDKDAWQEYLKNHSADEMKTIVLQGSDEHKVKGGCKKCSDEEIIGALEYMLRQASKAEDKK